MTGQVAAHRSWWRRYGPDMIHAAVCAAVLALGLLAGLGWSLIAVAVDDRVADTSWAEEGTAYKVLELSDGRSLVIDEELMSRLGGPDEVVGQRLTTDMWERTATIGIEAVDLRWPRDATMTLMTLGLIVAVGLLRRVQRTLLG